MIYKYDISLSYELTIYLITLFMKNERSVNISKRDGPFPNPVGVPVLRSGLSRQNLTASSEKSLGVFSSIGVSWSTNRIRGLRIHRTKLFDTHKVQLFFYFFLNSKSVLMSLLTKKYLQTSMR
jgi:hypothetical protein